MRLRIFFLTMDTDPDVPLVTQRVLNDFKHFGDDMMRMSGIGEFASNWPLFGNPYPTNYTNALSIVAQRGWPFQQHSLSTPEDTFTLQTFQTVNETYPIADLHWSIAHVPTITPDNIAAAKALGVGLALHGFQYLVGSGGGPPYRSIVDSGIRAGAGSEFRADIDARSMADALLHGYRQKRAGSARQCRADADTGRGAAPLHGGQSLVLQGRRQAWLYRTRQARRPRRDQR